MSQYAPMPDGKVLTFPDDTPQAIMEHAIKQHLMGNQQGPITPSPKEALQSRSADAAEQYVSGGEDSNYAPIIAEGLSLGTTKPLFGIKNAVSEYMSGRDPGAGYTAGETAYDAAMAKRNDATGWGGTAARTAASLPTAGVLTMMGVSPMLVGGVSGASYNANDPTSAAEGGAIGAVTSKAADWGINKLFGGGAAAAAPKPYEGPPVPLHPKAIPFLQQAAQNIEDSANTPAPPRPNLLRRVGADALNYGAKGIESDLIKYGSMGHALSSLWGGDIHSALQSGAAATIRPYVATGARWAANKLATPAAAEATAPGALKTLMNPMNQMSQGPTRAELARSMALGLINSGPLSKDATAEWQGYPVANTRP